MPKRRATSTTPSTPTKPDKNRSALCSFTFSDGRRCRAPIQAPRSKLCTFHASKELQAEASEEMGRDIGFFFSGRYLSGCDLNAALGKLFASVAQGHMKLKTASTLAYIAQTMVQALHFSQHEYINAFSTDGWRRSVSNTVQATYDYRFPDKDEHEDEDHADEDEDAEATDVVSSLPATMEEFAVAAIKTSKTGTTS
jgi:hypothetical protein